MGMSVSIADACVFRRVWDVGQGCGVVQMEDAEAAREAVAVLNGSQLQNTVILVQPDARASPEDLGSQARGRQQPPPTRREAKGQADKVKVKADPTRLG